MATGNLIKLGTLHMGGAKQIRPTRPWRADTSAPGTSGTGDIPNYIASSALDIRNTDASDAYKMQWVEVNDGDKKLLIGDRVALVNISWDDLNAQGLITGKKVTIDGQEYLLRILSGGDNYRTGTDAYSGGKLPNEWDKYITNESSIPGLLKPAVTDLDSSPNATDATSAHNKLWNWYYIYSWARESIAYNNNANRAIRGYNSARRWGYNASTDRPASYGLRPVLEILNTAPTISGTDSNLGDKANNFDIKYQINDSDAIDTLTLVEKVDGVIKRTVTPAQRAFEYTLPIDVNSLALGTHTATIEVSDDKGAKTIRTYTFSKTNTPPTISGKDENLGNKNLGFQIVYQVNDADGDELTVTEKLNGTTLRTLSNPSKNADLTIDFTDEKIRGLALDSSNTVVIEAKDTKGGIAYRTYTFKRVNTPPAITGIDDDLGLIATPFTKDYTVTDAEGDDVVVKELLNGVELKSYQVTLGESNTTVFTKEDFVKLTNGDHVFEIKATDIAGTTSTRTFNFSKKESKIKLELKAPFKTDAAATKVFISPSWNIEHAESVKVEVCNNAFDDAPTWENITDRVMDNSHFNLSNATKTALDFGVNVRITIVKDPLAEGTIEITGFGGAFE